MLHIVITDTDTNETVLDRECVAIVGGISTADKNAIDIVHAKNSGVVLLALATAAAVNSIGKVFEHNPDIERAVTYAYGVVDEEGGDEE